MKVTPQNMLDHAHELCEDEDYVNALEYFDMVLEMEPNNLNAIIDKGVTFQNLEYFTKALQMYDKALSIEPENSDALINKGSILNTLKK
jgi:Tfp pilus assembly protein PilF